MRRLCVSLGLALLVMPGVFHAQERSQTTCAGTPVYGLLDFWLGDWQVYVGHELVGYNTVRKVLDGCAITEEWRASDGGRGMSLFFVDNDGRWQQVWVTGRATIPGGTKQKAMIDTPGSDSVRFQGRIAHPDIGAWLDRTTLTPEGAGIVRQLIEISKDNGKTWQSTFDALYRPAE